MSHYDTIEVEHSPMRICVAEPTATGPAPLVVVMCHIGGLDAFTEDCVQRLADAGYLAAAPDVFHYHPWEEEAEARRAGLVDARIIADVQATIDHASRTCAMDSERIAIIGHCMGGRTALLAAGAIAAIGPLVIYYGGRTMRSWGGDTATPFARIASVRGPVMGFFGNDDTEPSPADVNRIEAEFARHDVDCEFHRYDGAGHAFQNFLSEERYRPEATRDSWERMMVFLQRSLRQVPAA